jgi:hypothetical protein
VRTRGRRRGGREWEALTGGGEVGMVRLLHFFSLFPRLPLIRTLFRQTHSGRLCVKQRSLIVAYPAAIVNGNSQPASHKSSFSPAPFKRSRTTTRFVEGCRAARVVLLASSFTRRRCRSNFFHLETLFFSVAKRFDRRLRISKGCSPSLVHTVVALLLLCVRSSRLLLSCVGEWAAKKRGRKR